MNGPSTKRPYWRQHWLGLLLVVAVLLAIPFVAALGGQAWVRIIDFAILYVFLALGLNIVVGYAGLLDLGYVAFYAVGAYLLRAAGQPALRLSTCLSGSSSLARAALSPASVRRTARGRRRSSCVATIWRSSPSGFGEIMRIFMNNLNAPINITNGAQGITLDRSGGHRGLFKFSTRRRVPRHFHQWSAEVLLPVVVAGAGGHRRQLSPAEFAHRPRLAGDSRG
jgi:branched-chain amino acid transport system permease protein